MHIKRYVAATLEEAVAQVKAELGPDALVLSTRRVRRDGGLFGWLGRPMVELVAAVDRERRPDARPAAPVEPHPSWQPLALTQALLDPLEAELRALRADLERQRAAQGIPPALAAELAELRQTVEALAARGERLRDPLARRLAAAGFAPRHARALAEAAGAAAGGDARDARAALPAVLAERLDARMLVPREDDPATVSLFVGAAGVGKTTTVAKLAGRAAGRERLALCSTDVHRAGGCEALRGFARERGIPFATAAAPERVLGELTRSGHRRVLVDTAGAGRSDAPTLAELARLRAALGPRARVHLVVSATTRADAVRDELRRFAPLAPDALVVTRLDDTDRLGDLANLLLDDGVPPLAWLGTGRRVPEDLALPEPRALAERLLGAAA